MSNYGADPVPDKNRIRQVTFGYELAPLDDLKVDQFSTASSDKVYHCIKKIGSTRIQFLVDPDLLPD